MANQEQLDILKQGVEVWNNWREENPKALVELREADLTGTNLIKVNLSYANLTNANLSNANLTKANLREAHLWDADLKKTKLWDANLSDAILIGANLLEANMSGAILTGAKLGRSVLVRAVFIGANLIEANLKGADLTDAYLKGTRLYKSDLSKTNLSRANFSNADLSGANLSEVNVKCANFIGAHFGNMIITQTDLSEVHGLEKIRHSAPSAISTSSIQISKGEIPDVFLRGCGLSDWEIEAAKLYGHGLSNQEINNIIYKIFDLRANQVIQISPLFISYSHADTSFVEKLEPRLMDMGIRFWRDTHDMKAGRMEKQVDRAIRQNPTVILILSENSTSSDWVEHEARLARELEKEIGRDVLCPIALDDSWKSAKWPTRLMEQIKEYNILDYSNWKDDTAFGQVFNKMIAGLDMFYKPEK